MSSEKTPNTCLFTGQLLDDNTKVEHTIPESIGGRIRSKIVCCSDFNQKCSGTIDKSLAEAFSLIYNRLDPLLPSAHSPGSIDVVHIEDDEGEDDGNYRLRPGGKLESHGFWVKKRNEQGHPKEIEGEMSAVLRFAKKKGIKIDKVQKTRQPEGVFRAHFPNMHGKEIELAVIKSALLSFDALLSEKQIRFTRDVALEPIRSHIKNAIMNCNPPVELFSKYVWGIRYDSLDRIHYLRDKYGDGSPSDFEHILIACGNAAQKTIYIVWCIFGFEAHGFRLTWDWDGRDFNYILSSGILRDTHAPTKVNEFASPFELGPRIGLRSVGIEEVRLSSLQNELAEKRKDAFQKAVELVEMKANDYVIQTLMEYTRSNGVTGSICRGIEKRLFELYSDRVEKGEGQKIFREIMKEISDSLPDNKRNDVISEVNDSLQQIDWCFWLDTYRRALGAMKSKLGLPGALNYSDIEAECGKFGQLKPAKKVLRKKPKK